MYANLGSDSLACLDNCSVETTGGGTDRRCDPGGGYTISGSKVGARGSITVRNAVISGTATAGIHLINTAPAGSPQGNVTVVFENIQLRDSATQTECTQSIHDWFNRPKGTIKTINVSRIQS
jgi:hypothetical protein